MIPKNAAVIPELNEGYTLAAMNAWSEAELYWQIQIYDSGGV